MTRKRAPEIPAPSPAEGPITWKLPGFCRAANVSVPMVYKLPAEQQPRSVYIGAARIVVESPPDWLRRVGTVK